MKVGGFCDIIDISDEVEISPMFFLLLLFWLFNVITFKQVVGYWLAWIVVNVVCYALGITVLWAAFVSVFGG